MIRRDEGRPSVCLVWHVATRKVSRVLSADLRSSKKTPHSCDVMETGSGLLDSKEGLMFKSLMCQASFRTSVNSDRCLVLGVFNTVAHNQGTRYAREFGLP